VVNSWAIKVSKVILWVGVLMLQGTLIAGHSFKDDVVMRDAVIGNEGTAIVVTGKFDHGGIDLINRSEDALPIDLNDGLALVHSGGCKLSVN
jgi:hypothetical protein